MSSVPSQYSSGQPAVPPRRSGMTTAGKVLFFLGLILSVIAIAVGIWGVSRAIQDFGAMADGGVAVEGSATVPMEAADMRFIFAPQGTDPACTVTDPGGTDVPVTSDSALDQAAAGEEGVTVVGSFTATQAGEHTVTCDAAAELSPALGFDDAIGIGTATIAFLSLFPLGFLTLLGLVLWLVGRSRDKKAALSTAGYGYGYSTSSGYGTEPDGTQGYGAPGQPYGSQGTGYGQGAGSPYGSPPPPGSGSTGTGTTGSPYGAPPPPGSHRGDHPDDPGQR